MKFVLANHSSYPRIGPTAHQQRLRRAQAARDRGEIDDAAVVVVAHDLMAEVVAEQGAAGLDIVTDGQVRGDDPVSHLMGTMTGVRINGLLRYFDSNFYYRQPVVHERIARGSSPIVADWRLAQDAATRPVKAVLLGPYTLAHLAHLDPNGAYHDRRELADDLSMVLAHEVRALAAAGAALIQIDEPALTPEHADDIRLLRSLFERLYDARGEAQLAVATYFAEIEPLYAHLNSIPADIVALDLINSPLAHATIERTGAGKVLALGVVDGRTTRHDDLDAAARLVERVLRRYTLDRAYLQPSCGLEFLPRDRAQAKLASLAQIRERLTGGSRQ